MTDRYTELERLARESTAGTEGEWFAPGVLRSYSRSWLNETEDAYIAACPPAEILRLVAIARAAEKVCTASLESGDRNWRGLYDSIAALRLALGEKP